MDAHLFFRFCEELAPRIIGGWLEKVQEPAPGLLAFNINLPARGQTRAQAGGSRKCQLCLRAARKEREAGKQFLVVKGEIVEVVYNLTE